MHAFVTKITRAAAVAMILCALACSGCSSLDMTARIPMNAVAKLSPVPQVVSPMFALDSAQQYVKDHPGSDFAVGSGDSMLPLYHDHAVIILERPPLNNLQVGQTVVFMSSNGFQVAHILVGHASQGWITMGLNNRERDPDVLSERCYIGVVVKAYQPTASVTLAYALSVAANKTYVALQ